MTRVQKLGGVAALINAAVATATLVVAFGLIGLESLTDSEKLVNLAINNPTPLIIQDGLKFVMAITSVALITALFDRLKSTAPNLLRIATLCGLLAVLFLLINACLSLFSISQTTNSGLMSSAIGKQLTGTVGLLGLGVIFLYGVWYLLTSWIALKHNRLPKRLSQLGIAMGLLSLLPLLGILVLLLSVVWSLWLGQMLLKSDGSREPG